MSIIASNMFYKIKDRDVMKGFARELSSLCEHSDASYVRKREIGNQNIAHFATLGNLFVVSIDNKVAVTNLPKEQSVIDVIGQFFDRSIYTTNAKEAIDLASIIFAGSPRAVTRIDIDTGRFEPESDVLIKRISRDTEKAGEERILIQVSVLGSAFEIEAKDCLDDVKEKLSVLLKENDDEDEE